MTNRIHPRWTDHPDYDQRWLETLKLRTEYEPSGCWLWKGNVGIWGYGQRGYRHKTKIIHRVVFQILNRVTLTRWQLVCHRCDTPRCWNPDHLFLGTPSDNILDSAIKGRHRNARKTHCKRGHELVGANVYISKRGLRNCKVCSRARMRMNAGWPEDLAYSLPITPHGYQPLKGRFHAPTA